MSTSNLLSHVGRLLSNRDTALRRKEVACILGLPGLYFPGVQPVSFNRNHFSLLENNDYYVLEKTDGVRCLLYLTQELSPGGEVIDRHYLIDRANRYFALRNTLPLLKHTGSEQHRRALENQDGMLMDGELITQCSKDGQICVKFLVFDCLATNGINITRYSFTSRRQKIKAVFASQRMYADTELMGWADARQLTIELKPILPSYRIRWMFEQVLPNLPHNNDGLIFVCKESPYVFGTDVNTIKWKPPSDNTADFRLHACRSSDVLDDRASSSSEGSSADDVEFELQAYHGSRGHQRYANVHLPVDEVLALEARVSALNTIIVECLQDATGTWRLKLDRDGSPRIRYDKKRGNHIAVVEDILRSSRDGVERQELQDRARYMRTRWKQRNPPTVWAR